MRVLLLILFLLPAYFIVNAQPCGGPGHEPDKANAVCGYLPFNEKVVSNCSGPDIPNPTSGCGQVTSDNSVWYKFHCYASGLFGFVLNPASTSDDYDWEIMDITGHPPTDVYNTELRVSLNLSGQPGKTGITAAGVSDINCGGGAPGTQFNRFLNLVVGHDYLMMVNNWTSSTAGYDLVFSGNALLTDPVQSYPSITSVAIVGCDASKLKVTFSEDILCDSISPVIGTEFSVTTGTHPITGVISDCQVGANNVPSVIISFQNPIPPGSYQLNVANGSDGNTLANACRNSMPPTSVPFTVPTIAAAAVNTITYSGCAPTVLDVKLTKPVFCSSITFSGSNSEFTIQPGNIPVTSVQGVCSGANPYADLIHVNLQNPLPFGNYQLVINSGPDGDTFIDTCGNSVIATSIPFVINQTTVAPIIQSVLFDECHPDKLVVNFNKNISCTSISPNANEFSVTPGAWAIANVNYNCSGTGNTTNQVVLTLQNPLPAGNFTVNIGTGADGTTLADSCYAFMINGYSKSFVTTKAPAPKFDSVQFDKCNPSFVKLFYSKPVKCSSVSIDGSDYNITGPSALTINAAVTDGNCGTLGYTNWIQLQFAQPVNSFGNYVVHNKTGNDSDGIIDTCNAAQNIAETIAFTALVKPSAAFTSQVKFACVMDTVTFTHPGGNGINSWVWTFADGSTATGQTVKKTFPVSTVTTSVQLKVDNGACSDVVTQDITLDNAFHADLAISPKDTTCINTSINFTNNSTGKNLQYLWLFGDATQFAGQTPPPHVYANTGKYNIKLATTDPYGCTDTARTVLQVLPLAVIDFTGLSAQYCTDQTISLAKNSGNTITSYTWDNGNGVTFKDKPNVQFSYPAQGNFTITLTGTDKYCGAATATKTVDIFETPKINLGNDTTICAAIPFLVGPPPVNGYTYLWNNGATSSQIFTTNSTATYSLQADNNGCKATDAMSVKVLSVCLIMIPNAFTPNNDGNNDKLRATNADLAKEFSLKVYNRFGELMYSSTNPLDGWDGTRRGVRADAGTYIWQLNYIDPWNGKKIVENGTSILLR